MIYKEYVENVRNHTDLFWPIQKAPHFVGNVHFSKSLTRLMDLIHRNKSITLHLRRRQNTKMIVEKTGRL
ncbi:hypothetical protein TH59_02235 [Pantoea ananatis]|nr:hypothetical protein AW734_12205 [Pantoea ananatis]PKC39740.1 hypothetical protein V462_05105 [Pantoea ananatis 15320]ASN15648.1 hypothetical protein B7764_10715 [Pantoea ananatis]MDC7863773.1 hypothetical protein [Pantoea ananatis]PQK69672.1 hypothetical protein CG427_21380 [Pantoea ananatis]